MSTNALITIEGVDNIYVYKHWDGYPDATLQWLKDFNESFKRNRGDDSSYKAAQLLRSSAFDAEKYVLDASKYTGWGVFTEYNGGGVDVDYIYKLMKDGSVGAK